ADPTATGATFLRIDPTVPTIIEGGAHPVAGVTVDIDGSTRSATTPDIGADEFEGIPLPEDPLTIVYTPIAAGCQGSGATLTTVITSGSGVPTTGTGLPRLRWRVNGGSWNWTTGAHSGGDDYSFTFGASVVGGDLVEYYVVAQDSAGMVTMWPTGGGGFSIDPPTANPAPDPDSFTVLLSLNGV